MTGLAHVSDLRAASIERRESRGIWLRAGRLAAQAFYVAVTLVVFANVQDRTQTITVALIGLVFASLRATSLASACAQRRAALLLEIEIRNMRQMAALGTQALAIGSSELDWSIEAPAKPLNIEYAGVAAIGAICLYHLAVAILYGMAYQQILELP